MGAETMLIGCPSACSPTSAGCADFERAIRRHERDRIRKLLDGDMRRFAHAMGRVLVDPPEHRADRAALITALEKQPGLKRLVRDYLDGDLGRLAVFVEVLFEGLDEDEARPRSLRLAGDTERTAQGRGRRRGGRGASR